MKKVLGVFLALAMLGSLFAFVGCNRHEDLIKGDFSRAATAEQRSEVSPVARRGRSVGRRQRRGVGRQRAAGRVRQRHIPRFGAGGIVQHRYRFQQRRPYHLLPQRGRAASPSGGSGALDMKMDINASGMRMNTSMRGSIYNDMSRIYMDVNYTASASVNGRARGSPTA